MKKTQFIEEKIFFILMNITFLFFLNIYLYFLNIYIVNLIILDLIWLLIFITFFSAKTKILQGESVVAIFFITLSLTVINGLCILMPLKSSEVIISFILISEFKISSQAFPPSAIKSPDLSLHREKADEN